jgi:hypothetical protein
MPQGLSTSHTLTLPDPYSLCAPVFSFIKNRIIHSMWCIEPYNVPDIGLGTKDATVDNTEHIFPSVKTSQWLPSIVILKTSLCQDIQEAEVGGPCSEACPGARPYQKQPKEQKGLGARLK